MQTWRVVVARALAAGETVRVSAARIERLDGRRLSEWVRAPGLSLLDRLLAGMERDQQAQLELSDIGVHFQLVMGPHLRGEAWIDGEPRPTYPDRESPCLKAGSQSRLRSATPEPTRASIFRKSP